MSDQFDGFSIYLAKDEEYSGRFNVRIAKRVHRELAIEAARAGLTLNAIGSPEISAIC